MVTGLLFNIQKFSLHDGPGIRTVVFFNGCPLSCRWCANPESRQGDLSILKALSPDAGEYTVDQVLEICLQDQPFYEESGGGVTLSGGEVLAQGSFAAALLRALKERKIHSVLETSGFAPPEIFDECAGAADLLLFDIKHYDSRRHAEGTGVPTELIHRNLRSALAMGKQILPRIPVIPGFNDAPEDAEGFSRLFQDMGLKEVQILPFHQFGKKKYEMLKSPYALRDIPQLHTEDLEAFRQIFLDHRIDCFF
ncbi:MAG: glycyl-radical enzyme activating protein [Treponema sp.]|jgi:pyruvate formate lyase activating enzyme|nr:glycyl-radical enzyme activating protein [Treponema sp.]